MWDTRTGKEKATERHWGDVEGWHIKNPRRAAGSTGGWLGKRRRPVSEALEDQHCSDSLWTPVLNCDMVCFCCTDPACGHSPGKPVLSRSSRDVTIYGTCSSPS